MRLSGFGVIASFRLPPGAPEAVQEAQERYESVADRYAEHMGRIEDAEAAVEAAKAKDAREAVTAAMEGGDLSDVNVYEREARSRLDALRRALPALEQALDEAGNAMLGPIAEAAESWATEIDSEAEEAGTRYEEAVAEAGAALDELGRARSAAAWLRAFDAGQASGGHEGAGWHGKVAAPAVTVEDMVGRQFDARELLSLAARASAGGLQSLEERREQRHAEAQREREEAQAEYQRERKREEASRV
jgi:hypothetical protein